LPDSSGLLAAPRVACQLPLANAHASFVLSARMQRAHEMLLSAGDRMTMTEIATQSGIWHLGRFSKYYKQFFGCTPLQTQRRIWARPVLGPEI
jgi:transcriptional regulator GlxA family with amidase domain